METYFGSKILLNFSALRAISGNMLLTTKFKDEKITECDYCHNIKNETFVYLLAKHLPK